MSAVFKGRDIISIKDLDRGEILQLFEVAETMEPLAKKGSQLLSNKIIGILFYEPSTRTRLSFDTAIRRLGGSSVGFAEPRVSSVEKGETLSDTVRVVENYVDAIVLRHPLEGAARLAAEFSAVPVINAGSGAEEHPTQALLDLYTIKREKRKIDGLNIGLIGDLRYGRTVHSLAYGLAYFDINLYLISPPLLRMRREVLEDISADVRCEESEDIRDVISKLDVLYVTRIQKERFADLSEYEAVRGSYRITLDLLRNAKSGLIILHPLPRVSEISQEVDQSRYAKYFRAVWYGLLVRMALLALILGAVR